jgi:hypothetical protein
MAGVVINSTFNPANFMTMNDAQLAEAITRLEGGIANRITDLLDTSDTADVTKILTNLDWLHKAIIQRERRRPGAGQILTTNGQGNNPPLVIIPKMYCYSSNQSRTAAYNTANLDAAQRVSDRDNTLTLQAVENQLRIGGTIGISCSPLDNVAWRRSTTYIEFEDEYSAAGYEPDDPEWVAEEDRQRAEWISGLGRFGRWHASAFYYARRQVSKADLLPSKIEPSPFSY